jgi:hypothetical protein
MAGLIAYFRGLVTRLRIGGLHLICRIAGPLEL